MTNRRTHSRKVTRIKLILMSNGLETQPKLQLMLTMVGVAFNQTSQIAFLEPIDILRLTISFFTLVLSILSMEREWTLKCNLFTYQLMSQKTQRPGQWQVSVFFSLLMRVRLLFLQKLRFKLLTPSSRVFNGKTHPLQMVRTPWPIL